MAKFTQLQAENIVTIRDQRFAPVGVHSHYSFIVKDNNGFFYKWVDKELAKGATKAEKKLAIYAYLKTQIKHPKSKSMTKEEDKHNLLGKIIKDA